MDKEIDLAQFLVVDKFVEELTDDFSRKLVTKCQFQCVRILLYVLIYHSRCVSYYFSRVSFLYHHFEKYLVIK